MNRQIYSVSSLNRYVKQVLDNDMNISSVLVKGEISNFTNHRSGHWYFTLKDRHAKISCVMFATYACKSKILLKEGMQVLVRASLSMYEAQGSCQLFVTSVQVDGLGDLYLELEQVKERMRLEGFFQDEHKKTLPDFPMTIGIITAKTGAAIQDILTTIARRWPLTNVKVFPTLVQGIQAVPAILESLACAEHENFDVILLARGGGAIEDLWCFNDESLAKFIYSMETPVVTGIGHESDTTLVDYVSDARAPTPTAAAELITPDILEIKSRILQYRKTLIDDISYQLEMKRHHLSRIQDFRYIKDPLQYVQQQRMQLAMHTKSLEQGMVRMQQKHIRFQNSAQRFLQLAKNHVERQDIQVRKIERRLFEQMDKIQLQYQHNLKEKVLLLDAFSPLKVLARGYSIAYKDGQILHSVHEVNQDDQLQLRLPDGSIDVRVQHKKGTDL